MAKCDRAFFVNTHISLTKIVYINGAIYPEITFNGGNVFSANRSLELSTDST